MEKKLNCWEYFQCGREPGGLKEKEFGVCPVVTNRDSDGINKGHAAGRVCWTIEGSLCKVTHGHKFKKCLHCAFFQEVERQEERNFVLALSHGN